MKIKWAGEGNGKAYAKKQPDGKNKIGAVFKKYATEVSDAEYKMLKEKFGENIKEVLI